MQRHRAGLLRIPLSTKLSSINSVINVILAAKTSVIDALICELQLDPEVATHFHYLLALFGHLYCYTYEVLGPRIILTAPDLVQKPSAVLSGKEISVVFENPDYLLDIDIEEVQTIRRQNDIAPVTLLRLPNFQMRHFPPFNPQLVPDAIPKYGKVVLGGTFDYLHPGHLILLTSLAFVTTGQIYLALTRDEMLKSKKHAVFLQSFNKRVKVVAYVMQYLAPHVFVEIFGISDPVGPAATEAWDAIILSREVAKAGDMINEIRGKAGLLPLTPVLVDLVQLGTHKISSTDIRALLSERCNGHGEELKTRWTQLCQGLGVGEETSKDWWSEICSSYSRHDRYYHTLEETYLIYKVSTDTETRLSPCLELALWFQDLVFYPDLTDNEEKSAEACEEFIRKAGIQGCDQASTYIRATKAHHPISGEENERLFLDLNVSVLGSSRSDYQRYSEQVRKEYSFSGNYAVKRSQFIAEMLARDTIFLTETFKSRYESVARKNLQWELEVVTTRFAQL